MGSKYSSNSASGFDSVPPVDDGTVSESNKVKWSTIKGKLATPVKDLADAINSDLATHFDHGPTALTSNTTLGATHYEQFIQVSGSGVTLTLTDAATLTGGWNCWIRNTDSSNSVTIGRATGADTFNGSASNYTLVPGEALHVYVNAAANGFFTADRAFGNNQSITGTQTFSGSPLTKDLMNDVCNGRLTLTTAVPVTTSDVTAATTLYFTPYKGNRIAVYDGTNWGMFSFSELSIAVPATTNQMYDVFCYNNAGTLTLELTAWTNDTTRATALTFQNGVYVKTGVTTRRYIGSFRTTAVSGQTEDSASKRYVYNYYNRVLRHSRAVDATDSWSYTLATYQQANASASNQLDFVVGVSEDLIKIDVCAYSINTNANIPRNVGIGVNSTSANSAQRQLSSASFGCVLAASIQAVHTANYEAFPSAGRNYYTWLEASNPTGTTTWYGDNGGPTFGGQSGISGSFNM